MNKMALAFNTTVAALEDELTQLILEGLINARIDSHSKVYSSYKAHIKHSNNQESLRMYTTVLIMTLLHRDILHD